MKPMLVGLGEILWDLLPAGRQMGGAPANFACHAAALGAAAAIISRVGDDDDGRALTARIAQFGLSAEGIKVDPAAPTGTVSVRMEQGHPHYTIHECVAWDYISAEAACRRTIARADAVCFGTLAQRNETSRRAIRSLLQAAPPRALRVFDVNLRQQFHSPEIIAGSLALANVLKVNDAELPYLAGLFRLDGDDRAQLAALTDRFQLRAVALTRGERGSLLHADGQWSDLPGVPARVVDTVGAGDSFAAAMTLGLLAGWPLKMIHRRASDVAAFVCSQPGATPALPRNLREPFTLSFT